MSLNSNNQQLQTILDTVNALPEAGGSSAPETCTVTILHTENDPNVGLRNYTRFVNGKYEFIGVGTIPINNSSSGLGYRLPLETTIHNVVVGSIMELSACYADMPRITGYDSNCAYIFDNDVKFYSTYSYVDPDSITELEGTIIGENTLSMGSRWGDYDPILCLRILGDTTIKIWDAD